jgi:hypothetical protein
MLMLTRDILVGVASCASLIPASYSDAAEVTGSSAADCQIGQGS